MHVTIEKQEETLKIKVHHPRMDGENHILNALKEGGYFTPDIRLVELDFNNVEYINSLGITEIINIHRNFADATGNQVRFCFINVGRKVIAVLELVEVQKIAEIRPRPVL